MKKLIFLLAMLIAPSLFAQNPWVTQNNQLYNVTGTALGSIASTDTAYSASFDFFPYDSVGLFIGGLRGDTFSFVVKWQYGDSATWSPFTNCTAAGAADTVRYTTAATDQYGKAFTVSIANPARIRSPKARFVFLGTSLTGGLNGTTAEKWLFRLKVLKKMNP